MSPIAGAPPTATGFMRRKPSAAGGSTSWRAVGPVRAAGADGRPGSALCAGLLGPSVGAARDQRSQSQEGHELQQEAPLHHHAEYQDSARQRDEVPGHHPELPGIAQRHKRRHEIRSDPEQGRYDVRAERIAESTAEIAFSRAAQTRFGAGSGPDAISSAGSDLTIVSPTLMTRILQWPIVEGA